MIWFMSQEMEDGCFVERMCKLLLFILLIASFAGVDASWILIAVALSSMLYGLYVLIIYKAVFYPIRIAFSLVIFAVLSMILAEHGEYFIETMGKGTAGLAFGLAVLNMWAIAYLVLLPLRWYEYDTDRDYLKEWLESQWKKVKWNA